MPTRQEIAARVRRLREEHGSHDKLAEALGGKPVTRQSIIRHEKHGRMKLPMARRYAKLTGTKETEWLPDVEVVEVPLDLFLAVVERLERIADRLDDQGGPQSGRGQP